VILGLALALCACTPDPALPDDSGPPDSEPPGETGDVEPDDSDPPAELALLSLNLHCLKTSGTDFGSNPERFAAIAEAVAADQVRAIALQELCVSQDEDAGALLVQALEDATGLAWELATAFAHSAWEGTEDEADEYVGLAVQGGLLEQREIVFHSQEGLRRVGIQGRWDAGFAQLAISSVHLDHQHDDARLGQARQAAVEALVSDAAPASVVMGDFNDTPGSEATAAMGAMGYADLGAALDDDRIDYVWVHRGAPVEALGFERVFTGERWPEVSDHPGMLARLVAAELEPVTLTTVRTQHGAAGHYLAVRGDASPLDWELGWPASQDGDQWTAVFSELDGSFEYKWLLDDQDWQSGENLQGRAGTLNEGEVSF